MAARDQALNGGLAEATFEQDVATVRHALAGRLARIFMAYPWRVTGFLQVHAEIDQVDDDLGVRLGLHTSSHDTKAEPRFAIARDKSGNNCMERSLPRLEYIEVPCLQRKQLAAILEVESQLHGHHARSHAAVVTLDQGNHVSVAIGDRQIDCVTMFANVTCRIFFRRCLRINQCAPFVPVFL